VLDKGQENDWFASSLITDLTVTAALALPGFVIWELRRADPIVDLRLFASRSFAVGSLLMFMLGFVLLGSTVLLPLFVQLLLGYTATDAGLVLSPGGFALMLMMPLIGALSGKLDVRWLIAAGLVVTGAAMLHMTEFYVDIDYATVAWARVYQSVGLGLLFIPINTAAYSGVPQEKNNNASAIINMMRNIGGSVGIAVLTTLIARRQQYHQSTLAEHVTSSGAASNHALNALQHLTLPHHASAVDALHQAKAMLYATVQKQAAVLSYLDGFWVTGVGLIALVPLVFVMRRAKGGGATPVH